MRVLLVLINTLVLFRTRLKESVMSDTRIIGNVSLISLTDGHGSGSPNDIFPESEMEVWINEYSDLMDSDGLIHPRYGSVAVRSMGKLIIIDTGNGPPEGLMMDDLSSKGIDSDDVDLVLITHLHGDHVGWNFTNGVPSFPNARYLIPKADWDYWTAPDILDEYSVLGSQVLPLKEYQILDLIEGEYSITTEVTALPTPGHTPGHISVSIMSSGEKGFILGDVALSPAQAKYTDWNPSFDVDPSRARSTRHKVLDQLEADGSIVSAGHFPSPGFGKFVSEKSGRYWQEI